MKSRFLVAAALGLASCHTANEAPVASPPAPREPETTAGSRTDSELARLRRQYALRFCEPEPHVALAKHHHERGRKLLAYYILEAARGRFSTWEPDEGEDPVVTSGPRAALSFD